MMDMDPDPRPKPNMGGDSTPPAQMAAPSLEAGNEQLTVNWTPPTDTGGSDITAYELRHSDDGGISWSDIIEIPAPATETIITNLTNGTEYVAQVRAGNSAGAGDWSELSDGAIPITVPTKPNNFTLAADDMQITATWAAPTDTGGSAITRYERQYREVGARAWENPVSIAADANPLESIITSLTNGTEYEVRVYAVNEQGNGNPATDTTTPIAVPDAPTTLTLTAGDTEFEGAWTAPNDNGSAIIRYELQYREVTDPEGSWLDVTTASDITAASSTITGLTNGTTYDVRVRAVNAVGNGGWSAPATRRLLPSATRVSFGTAASVILSAAIDTQIADEGLTVTLTTATTPVAGVIVTSPTVDASTGVITVSADTTAGTYVVSGATGGENTFTEKFYVTVSPADGDGTAGAANTDGGNDELDAAIAAGISTWGQTADLNYIITTAITDMSEVFKGATHFNGDISGWDTSAVTTINSMFYGAFDFNGGLSNWDVSSVTDMSAVFFTATSFNQDISNWDVSSVTTMYGIFASAGVFNSDISAWDVSKVTTMAFMFNQANEFKQNISGWDVSKVTTMESMFQQAVEFDQNISGWDVSSVTTMNTMFNKAYTFDQDLEEWKDHWSLAAGTLDAAGDYTGTTTDMFLDSGLDANTLVGTEDTTNYPSWY